LSALSNVRLDNFVYTVECFDAARRHLAPGGGVVLYFMVGQQYILERLFGMMAQVFHETPVLLRGNFRVFNTVLMVGPAFQAQGGELRKGQAAALAPTLSKSGNLASDDWPYLYLENRTITRFYIEMGAALLFTSLVGIGLACGVF